MARNTNTTDAKAPETQAPETQATETQATETQQATTDAKAEKVYNFRSANKFLSCVALGVQFVDGKASTKSLAVAKALTAIKGVELIEE